MAIWFPSGGTGSWPHGTNAPSIPPNLTPRKGLAEGLVIPDVGMSNIGKGRLVRRASYVLGSLFVQENGGAAFEFALQNLHQPL